MHCLSGESHRLAAKPPALSSCLLSPPLSKSSQNRALTNGLRPDPVQLELPNYSLICIFTDPSDQLHNDQSERVIPLLFEPMAL